MKLLTAAQMRDLPHGRLVRACGIVTARQQPPTKGNAVFITLEDETGIVNCVLWARDFERLRRPVMAARLMLVEGRIQKSPEGVVHLMAGNVIDRSDVIDRLRDAHRAGFAPSASWLSPADEGSTLGEPDNGRDARRAPPQHPAPPPRNRHPRAQRILPKSRDFH